MKPLNLNHQTLHYLDADAALARLSNLLMNHGDLVGSRLGEQTREATDVKVVIHHPLDREILNPERKASLVAQIAETMWVLSGRNDIEWLSTYLPRAKDFSDDGVTWRGAYGARLRQWGAVGSRFDQLRYVVELLREDSYTRRAVISLYDASIDSQPGKDIPCNNRLHFLARGEELNLIVSTRSNDLIWGWSGINQFEWSVLLEIVARLTDLDPGVISYDIGSLHLYDRHFERAVEISGADVDRPDKDSPRFRVSADLDIADLDDLFEHWFTAERRIRTGDPLAIEAIEAHPEPMMRSWLRVLYAWHTDTDLHPSLAGTRLAAAYRPRHIKRSKDQSEFVEYVDALHRRKHAAYGDSWRRRGEMLGILANIARKIDRLGVTDDDETAADTAIDLLVYLLKYTWWTGVRLSDEADYVAAMLRDFDKREPRTYGPDFKLAETESRLNTLFGVLEAAVKAESTKDRGNVLAMMTQLAFRSARFRWEKDRVNKGNETRSWNPELGEEE